MNKQVVIAGLLGAIAAAEGDDPTPCEDINTKAAAESLAAGEDALEAWQGKIEGLEEAAEADAELLESAQEAYNDVTAAVLPFYNAMEEAYEDWQAEVVVKQDAQTMLDNIEGGESNAITGETMLIGMEAPDVSGAWATVEAAQENYDTKYAEINSATYEDAEEETQTGFRAALTAEIRQESLALDAQELATSAEATAVENYLDQEALVNALLVIEGCATVNYADLGLTEEEEEATPSGEEAANDLQLTQFEECCNTRLSTFLGTLGEEATGDCSVNTGFGMKEQRAAYTASQTSLEVTYNGICENTAEVETLPSVNTCEGDTAYTTYKTAYATKMKADRLRTAVNSACTNSSTYDCSNGVLSNSGTAWTASTDSSETTYHMLNPADGVAANAENRDTIWAYQQGATVTTAADLDITEETDAWTAKYQGLGDALVNWTVAEARYWAYEAAYDIQVASYNTANTAEAGYLTTREQKYDLLDAADANVLAAQKLVNRYTEDLTDEVAALDALQATLQSAQEAHAVEVYLAAQASAAALVQQNIVDAWSETCGAGAENCSDALANLETLYNNAETNFTDIQDALSCDGFTPGGGCTGFYRTALLEIGTMQGTSSGALSFAEGEVLFYEGWIEMSTDEHTLAVAACKGLGYDKAQAAKKRLMDLEAANEEAAAEVLIDYTAKSAFADTGETNTLCAYPEKGSDGSQEPRPECKDGYCCGAAQKFLKDGTKLAIETCQKAEGVHTYDYYPPLPEGSPVEPTPETWRFQCISGAQKLAATAAAALAASYMMA